MTNTAAHILLVDDDPVLLEALSQMLSFRFSPLSIDTSQTATKAVSRFARHEYDCIISDVKMPGMDGLELLDRIQDMSPDVPVILITGHGEMDLAIKALRARAYDLVQKPIDRDYLLMSLGRAIELRTLRREVKAKQEALERHAEELEERVRERTAELTRANQAKDEFLGLVSHEMRTPLAVIIGNADLLHKRGDLLTPEDKAQLISDLRQDGWRLQRIIENMLALGKAELGVKSAAEVIDLTKLVERQVARHRQSFRDREFKLSCPPELMVECEPTYLELIVGNLISNAEKYSQDTQPIEVSLERRQHDVRVSVLDRGRGFTQEEANLLFQPFYRSADVRDSAPGVGIGLAVCKRLVEFQGGTIMAAHRDGGGSEFSILLPMAPNLLTSDGAVVSVSASSETSPDEHHVAFGSARVTGRGSADPPSLKQ